MERERETILLCHFLFLLFLRLHILLAAMRSSSAAVIVTLLLPSGNMTSQSCFRTAIPPVVHFVLACISGSIIGVLCFDMMCTSKCSNLSNSAVILPIAAQKMQPYL